ncbi:MAG: hypothetical protein EOP06_15525 [Proteobacteria bacterium]|nr:MAG: hypothetical protein EOP06_15525 [Pseudomonadota bacterium]
MVLSDNTVAFVPKEKLDQDTPYQVTFKLSEVIETPEALGDFKFTVRTIKQDFLVSILDLQSYSSSYNYVNGRLRSADAMDIKTARKLITAEFEDKSLKVKFDDKKSTPTDFRFIVDSIKRGAKDDQLEVKWDGDGADVDREGSISFPIAAKGSFKVLKIEQGDDTNQMITIMLRRAQPSRLSHKRLLIDDAQAVILSSKGNFIGGISYHW